MRSWRSK